MKDMISLTDIHKEHGAEVRFLPNKFIARFPEFVGTELITKTGRYGGGTWSSERMAKHYKRWISSDCDELSLRSFAQKESGALSAIEQVLSVKLIRQYRVGDYRIDGYDKENNIAYEIDEGHHKTTVNYAKDMRRQRKIEDLINCSFVRVRV